MDYLLPNEIEQLEAVLDRIIFCLAAGIVITLLCETWAARQRRRDAEKDRE